MPKTFRKFDEQMMRRCFALARRGQFRVRPNPMVGAVLVKNGRIIGEGYHHYFGGPHAEVEAFRNASEDPAGATLYCNLEPCCHTNKKTPPCTPLVISKKVARVVVANIDPNPDVSGKGLEQMRAAGIQVEGGLLEEEGAELNKFFFLNMKEGRPFVTLKVARSLDGFIAKSRHQQTWLSGPSAKRFVHRLRAAHQAVLVGAGTVLADDPQLTVRDVRGPQPWRLILDGKLNAPIDAKVFNDRFKNRTIVLTASDVPVEKSNPFRSADITLMTMDGTDGKLPLRKALEKLWKERQIGSLLVEGGQQVFSAFLQENLVDELIFIETPIMLGQGVPAFLDLHECRWRLKAVKKWPDDVALIYGKKENL